MKLSTVLLLAATAPSYAQSGTEFTLSQTVEASLQFYPSIRVSQEQMNVAVAAIQLARTAYLPRIDAFAQVNRATRNNSFGLLLPQSAIPSMSGPVIGSNNLGSVWGSAVGALVTWEPFDFGLRKGNVNVAEASKARAEAGVRRSEFEVAAAAADAYLTLIAAQETVRAAQAGVDRAQTLATMITARVRAQLRPGADQSRAEAELGAARTQLIEAQQAVDISKAVVAQFTGKDPATFATAPARLLELPPDQPLSEPDTTLNPAVAEQNATVEEASAQVRALERTYFPKFYLQGAAYARGTGAEIDGRRLGGWNGLAPNVQDYALGFSVTFPVLDFAAIRAREAQQNATLRSEKARSAQMAIEIQSQWRQAVARVDGARRIAANAPLQVSAARSTVNQATARYQAGLANVDEVAEAQRLLTQAEIDDLLARLGIWRGLLRVATAAGDLRPFVAEATR